MFGQMTAGSWIYIGTQEILQGTFETFAAMAKKHFKGSLKGKLIVSGGLGGMGGAQPLAVTMNEGVFLGIDVDPWRIEKRIKSRYLDHMTHNYEKALRLVLEAKEKQIPLSVGLVGDIGTILERWTAVENALSLFLLRKVVAVVSAAFSVLGLPLIRQGNVLILPHGQVGVADACSGIRSLTGCLFAGTFLAAVFLDRFWKKVLLVAAAMGLAFLTNLARSLFLTAWAYAYGSEAIEGTLHDATGYAVLGLTSLGLFCMLPLFRTSNWRKWLGLAEGNDAFEG